MTGFEEGRGVGATSAVGLGVTTGGGSMSDSSRREYPVFFVLGLIEMPVLPVLPVEGLGLPGGMAAVWPIGGGVDNRGGGASLAAPAPRPVTRPVKVSTSNFCWVVSRFGPVGLETRGERKIFIGLITRQA